MARSREPTLADVAERAGVSVTTVSRVLNARGYLSQDAKDRVARAIEELGYRPTAATGSSSATPWAAPTASAST